MVDKVTVSSHNSYGSRVGNSLKSILWWFLLVILSIVLLVRNEKNFVEQKAALDEWASIVQEAIADQINSELEWSEIHVSWQTASDDETLRDDVFWVVTDDLKLLRTVEMYQWYEDEDTECHDNYWGSEDCETTYTYDTKWSESAIDSNNFYQTSNHENPAAREYESNEWVKDPITLWAYTLTDTFIDKLVNYRTINLSEQEVITPEKYKNATVEQIVQTVEVAETTESTEKSVEDNNNSYLYGDSEENAAADTTEVTNTAEATNERFHINGDQIYIWLDPTKPAVWDLRITFSSVKPWTVSVVWKQVNSELTSYTASNWRPIALLEEGSVTAADMFLHAQQANKNLTWLLRILWIFLMYCGFAAMFKFIETIAKVLPFLANIIWVWTGLIALWLTLVVWFVTIWIAWIAVRPVIGISCLVVAAAWIFLLIRSKKNKKENPEVKEWDLPKEDAIKE